MSGAFCKCEAGQEIAGLLLSCPVYRPTLRRTAMHGRDAHATLKPEDLRRSRIWRRSRLGVFKANVAARLAHLAWVRDPLQWWAIQRVHCRGWLTARGVVGHASRLGEGVSLNQGMKTAC